ncbi:MAG: trimeric autotransporter adhesin [Mucilaginibacter sp.]|nr:trimeric autotransporter adhesin [Mucilaginibacter sp.]
MKPKAHLCLIVFLLLTAFRNADATNHLSTKKISHRVGGPGTGQDVISFKLLRLKLIIDSLNYDDIVIGFGASTSTKYNPQEDSGYLPGINAPEGLSSYSSDNVRLSVNLLPLPKRSPQVIRLDVEGAKSGLFRLQRTELDSIPPIYEIWLIDKYKKDSLDLRNNSSYSFYINKKDTNSFGSNRFQVVIRQNPALGIHLLNFIATKVNNGAEISWMTENEQDYTDFTIERSIDNGKTFYILNGITSNCKGSYSFLDKNPINGSDQYRVKITDLNGAVSYTSMITLSYGNAATVANNLNIYPNPSNGLINLSVIQNAGSLPPAKKTNALPALASINYSGASSYDIKIISTSGYVIKAATSSSANWQANVSNLAPGTYIIQVINNNDNSLVGKRTFIKL